MAVVTVPDNWWPDWMRDVADEDPLASRRVVIAEVEPTAIEYRRYRHLFTALVPPDRLPTLLEHPGGIGHDVSTSGPHPVDFRGEWNYLPQFWIDDGEPTSAGLEPLVVAWQAGNRTVLWPDQGFLMTYGLVPRLVDDAGEMTIHWDDPEAPQADVVVAKVRSTYQFPAHSGAMVSVAREFLEDYATIRGQALIQVYYAERSGPLTDEIRQLLGDDEIQQFRLKGRLVDLRRHTHRDDSSVLAQVWGVRMLLAPGGAPISAGRWEYGSLAWPGIIQPMTAKAARQLRLFDVAYVSDRVLGIYEGRPEFSIHPESGAVSHDIQWSVSPTRRVGRDLIAVDLKKLYEGNRSDIVHHWHSYAVPPPANLAAFQEQPNVGTRSRRLVYGLLGLGELLAELASSVRHQVIDAVHIVGLDRAELEYRGWWTANHVEPITRHIPIDLSKDAFLSRCNDLTKLVIEGLAEGQLRVLLQAIGIPSDDIKQLRSLRLLDLVVCLAELATQSGLSLQREGAELYERAKAQMGASPLGRLFALNELRQLADHRAQGSERRKLDDALKAFGLDRNTQTAGWGRALDRVYDGVADDLEAATEIVARGIDV